MCISWFAVLSLTLCFRVKVRAGEWSAQREEVLFRAEENVSALGVSCEHDNLVR